MTTPAAPLALAVGLLILSLVLAIALVRALDAELRRTTALRAAANDNRRAPAREPERRIG